MENINKRDLIIILVGVVLCSLSYIWILTSVINDQKKVIENGVCSCKFCRENN